MKGWCMYTTLVGVSMDEDREQNQDLDIESLTEEEYALEQKVIPFMGDELAAALTQSGGIYISLPGMCGALGLNTRGQLQRIQQQPSHTINISCCRWIRFLNRRGAL